MKGKNLIIVIILLVIVATGAFYAGLQYQKSNSASQGGQGRFGGRLGGNGNGTRPVFGKVIDVSNGSITVKMRDGSSKIVLISSTTSINKSDKASVSDLKTGENVAALGTSNPDGSITAQNIQLNPQMRMSRP